MIHKRLFALASLFTLSALLLNACATLPAQVQPTQTPSEEDVAPPQPTPLPQEPQDDSGSSDVPEKPVEMPEGALIVYHLSGGFAGLDESWAIYADGSVIAGDGSAFQVEASQVEALMASLRELGVAADGGDYTPMDTCCDRFFYELRLNLDGKSVLIKTADGATGVPEAVWKAIDLVQTFIEESASS